MVRVGWQFSRAALAAGMILMAVLAALPQAASALTAKRSGGTVVINAGPGEANDLTISYEDGELMVEEAEADWHAGSGCKEDEDYGIVCSGGSTPIALVQISTGDGDDSLDIDGDFELEADLGSGDDGLFTDDERPIRVDGGSGDDELMGSESDDTISGGPGADDLDAGGGNDQIDGGDGEDTLDDDTGADRIAGGEGIDVLGASRAVSLDGLPNDGAGDNFMPDIENVDTGGENDSVVGGPPANRIRTNEGDDTVDVRGGGIDEVLCGPGIDTVLADGDDRLDSDCEAVHRVAPDPSGPPLALASCQAAGSCVKVICPGSAALPCAGSVDVATKAKLRTSRGRARVRFGTGMFYMLGGEARELRIPAGRNALRALKRQRKLKVSVKATVLGPAGAAKTIKQGMSFAR